MYGIPNCVPEWFRSLQDDYNHEWELEMNRQEWYKANKKYRAQRYIDGCDEIRFYPDECRECPYGEEANPDSEYDDIPTMICNNWENCPVYRNDVKEHFPNDSWEEYCGWRKEYVQKIIKESAEVML